MKLEGRWSQMPQFSSEFWIQILIYAATFGTMYGQMRTQIRNLEQKVEKHNNMVERTYVLERDLKTAFRYIDELKEEQRHDHQSI